MVLHAILEWSEDRPLWQRDALRRLVLNGELSDDDIRALTEICKSGHGLAEPQDLVPLAKDHLPDSGAGSAPISLVSIFHRRGVNALAENQTLKFGPSLTVVYGDNAAGKTGYIRILKGACRARGQEHILGNVVSGATPFTPEVSIKYQVGDEPKPRDWSSGGDGEAISRVSVFDTQSASVYLTKETDVAFRPFGLDLFDKLVQACRAVRARLEGEQRALSASALPIVQGEVPPGTTAARLVANISSLTNPEAVRDLAHVSKEEEARLALLDQSLLDLRANDPEKLIRQLTLRASRVQALVRHLTAVEQALSPEAVAAVFEARTKARRKADDAITLRAVTFPEGALPGTGSETWAALWDAARRFSMELAYSTEAYPAVENDARCVLCQQDLDKAARDRLRKFEAFIVSTTEQELREAREALAQRSQTLIDLEMVTDAITETLDEIRIDHDAEASMIEAALVSNESRRAAVALALTKNQDVEPNCPDVTLTARVAVALVEQINERIRTLRETSSEEASRRISEEALELRARKVLAKHERTVLDDIERRKKYAAYGLCIDTTKTAGITQKSTALTKAVVSSKLKQSFRDELLNLNFRHVEVELRDVGGADGVLFHKLFLTRAPGVDLPKVVSEGEQRCLSIAAFFAELSTAAEASGIIFDDPVSSLDYKWRNGVALRLVHEAKTRQVIVFTHDVVFLLLLQQYAAEQRVTQLDQHVRHLAAGAGVCTDELPWVALKVSRRIGHLKKLLQDAEKLHRNGDQASYEREASTIYGLLREAWERGVEEVLLDGIVERFRPGVQTLHIVKIADITPEDCKAVEIAMTKCSKWLPGHDQAPAARDDMPEPQALKADIEALDRWVRDIRKRRE